MSESIDTIFIPVELSTYISKAKESSALPGVDWGSHVWELDKSDASLARERGVKRTGSKLVFGNLETSAGKESAHLEKIPLQEPFMSFAKAEIRLYAEARNVSKPVLSKRIAIHRILERIQRMKSDHPCPCSLTHADFLEAEKVIREMYQGNAQYKMAGILAAVSRVIDKNGLTQHPTKYKNSISRPLDGDELTEAGQEIGKAKMIPNEVLEHLGGISNDPGDDKTRLIIRIVDLLFVCGFRVSEVLSLPVNCWVEAGEVIVNPATGEKKRKSGILYAAEKAQDYRIKWLSFASVELAKRAIDELTELCEANRVMAKWNEHNPGRLFVFRDYDRSHFVSGIEACSLLGLAERSYQTWKMPYKKEGHKRRYRIEDIERYYSSRADDRPVFVMPSGKSQMLSDTLIVLHLNQLHGNRGSIRSVVTPISVQMFQDCLSPAPSRAKNIAKNSRLLPEGLRVKSHQFRHWINTVADSGGLSELDLAKWMGRKDISQNVAYKHGTLGQRTEAAKELILAGKTHGRIARIAANLPVDERKIFLDAAIEAVHAMEVGLCLHNFAGPPCPEHHKCLRGCGDYLRVKGDMDQRRALIDLKGREIETLRLNRIALEDGFYGADKWIESSEEHLKGINAALAVDDLPEEEANSGTQITVFPEANFKNSKKLK